MHVFDEMHDKTVKFYTLKQKKIEKENKIRAKKRSTDQNILEVLIQSVQKD